MRRERVIDAEFKERYWRLVEELGHHPNFQEQSELSAWYREQHSQLVMDRKMAERVEMSGGEVSWSGNPQNRKCVECGKGFVIEKRRGRPPTKCSECRELRELKGESNG